jgi:hypothetical protein
MSHDGAIAWKCANVSFDIVTVNAKRFVNRVFRNAQNGGGFDCG